MIEDLAACAVTCFSGPGKCCQIESDYIIVIDYHHIPVVWLWETRQQLVPIYFQVDFIFDFIHG